MLALFLPLLCGIASAQDKPTVKGIVVGGGCMADVEGNTHVYIYNCDTITSVYGGNDIAGEVKGVFGSTVVIGANDTLGSDASGSHLRIGSVYGGGNGFYNYGSSTGSPYSNITTETFTGEVYEVGSTDARFDFGSATTKVPAITHTHVYLFGDDVKVDSVFGGARNAFINNASGAVTANDVHVKLAGGTVYSVFGGNNVGGTLVNEATIRIWVTSTTTTAASIASSVVNDGVDNSSGFNGAMGNAGAASDGGFGLGHGVRYLFGGGNRVTAPTAKIFFYGGQVDTLFAGGNSADVASATVLFDVADAEIVSHAGEVNYAWNTQSAYNVRTLFGGNNQAAMSNIPTLNLVKGGIGTVYGGGNKGVMANSVAQPSSATFAPDTVIGTLVHLASSSINIDYLYGGGQMAGVDYSSYVRIEEGNVGTVYGGCNISGDVGSSTGGSTYVYISGGTVYGNVFGGANGFYHCNDGTNYVSGIDYDDANHYYLPTSDGGLADAPIAIPTHRMTTTHIWGNANVYGNTYAGGNLANVSSSSLNNAVATLVITGGRFGYDIVGSRARTGGNVYGGGSMASVYGVSNLEIGGSPVIGGSVYGGNDKSGTVSGQGRPVGAVASDGVTSLTADNAAAYVRIEGTPQVNRVFGGGNGDYNYFTYSAGTYVPQGHSEAYNASNPKHVVVCNSSGYLPVQSSAFVDIHMGTTSPMAEGHIDTVFGGGNGVTVGHTADAKAIILLNNVNTGSLIAIDAEGRHRIKTLAEGGLDDQVDVIFGGNNKVAMSILPDIRLVKGQAGIVFGGGNAGDMLGNANARVRSESGYDSTITNVSTYIGISSADALVSKAIFGGCNQANVRGNTVVDIREGFVANAYGGNDIGGLVNGTATVWLTDGEVQNIFGGSNGYYDYDAASCGTNAEGLPLYDAYIYNSAHAVADRMSSCTTLPYCSATNVVLRGGQCNTNVYGGGRAGDCGNTNLTVQASSSGQGTKVLGTLFGGGQGIVVEIGKCTAHRGNVTGTAVTNIHSMHPDSYADKIYGGGHAGDVANTNLTFHNDCNVHFNALYGGCMAANISGTATTTINAPAPTAPNTTSIDTVYGGNDFSGKVQNTVLTINSGTFIHAFGAGNGAYDYKATLSSLVDPSEPESSSNHRTWRFAAIDTVPYSMHVSFTVNDGVAPTANPTTAHDTATIFLNNIYGGGNMGLVGNKYIVGYTPGAGYLLADADCGDPSTSRLATASDEIYGDIVLTIHGGLFNEKIFTGARGEAQNGGGAYANKRFFGRKLTTAEQAALATVTSVTDPIVRKDHMQLVYGYKQLNMDGGIVYHTVHGGSEYIDDGYFWECRGTDTLGTLTATTDDNTTMRPSSTVNIVGGTIRKSVYGAGYEGTAYGSVYLNIGKSAVDSSQVWARLYGKPTVGTTTGADVSFASWRPRMDETNHDLVPSDLLLDASVYAGSDWGEAGMSAVFSTPGIYGGESRVFIDGRDYYTLAGYNLTTNPILRVAQSIIGAGTSTEGGDIFRFIRIRNYGGHECANMLNTIYSIQRADRVELDSVYVSLHGEQDRHSAYISPDYTICRVDSLVLHSDNMLHLTKPAIYIGHLISEKSDGSLYSPEERPDEEACESNLCAIYGTNVSKNVILISSGSYISLLPFVEDPADPRRNDNKAYSPVMGYSFFSSSDGTIGYIFARRRITTIAPHLNESDGGFWTACSSALADSGACSTTGAGIGCLELPYENYDGVTSGECADRDRCGGAFRSWQVGTTGGGRTRYSIVIASNTPDNYSENFYFNDGDSEHRGEWSTGAIDDTVHKNYAYAYGTALELPPSKTGNYYTVNRITIDNDNGGQISLIETAWDPDANSGVGGWHLVQNGVGADSRPIYRVDDGRAIETDPAHTFGLLLRPSPDGNFSTNCPVTQLYTTCTDPTVIADNGYFTDGSNAFYSPRVTSNVLFPKMDFILTYNTEFATTITRNVRLYMMEHDEFGNDIAPVTVVVTISTVMDDFKEDIPVETWAMYNGGIINTYERKIVLPATFHRRRIYLSKIEWSEYTGDPQHGCNGNFRMHDASTNPLTSFKDFAFTLTPTTFVADNLGNTLGWYDINGEASRSVDLFARTGLVETVDECDPSRKVYSRDLGVQVTDHPFLETGMMEGGMPIGTLDGRATAGMDVVMNFNGNLKYEDCESVGTVKLTFYYYGSNISDQGNFTVTINIRTRESSDTIYIASADKIVRNGITLYKYGLTEAEYNDPSERADRTEYWQTYIRQMTDQISYTPNSTDPMMKLGKLPTRYIGSLDEALHAGMYRDGDVIAFLDAVELSGSDNITPHGLDEVNYVQMIRYSGSHYEFPGNGSCYRGPMLKLSDNSHLSMYNVWLNGSGLTRVKDSTSVTPEPTADNVQIGSYYFRKDALRIRDTLFAYSPMIIVKDNAQLTLSFNARMTNNFNSTNVIDASTDHYFGGAIGMLSSPAVDEVLDAGGNVITPARAAMSPQVVLGSETQISDNLVVDHRQALTGRLDNSNPFYYQATTPVNKGAGIYNNGGTLIVGSDVSNSVVNISDNYFWNPTAATTDYDYIWFKDTTRESGSTTLAGATLCTGDPSGTPIMVQEYLMKVSDNPSRSNIFLTRERAGNCVTPEQYALLGDNEYLSHITDETLRELTREADCEEQFERQTDYITFTSALSNKSKIGVSKWFPGGYPSYKRQIRDTILFAFCEDAANASAVHQAGIFFADSMRFAIDTFYHPQVNPSRLYFHRCATFKKKQAIDSIYYHISPFSICPDGMDSMFYKVQGGFPGYTFDWYLHTFSYSGVDDTKQPGHEGYYLNLTESLQNRRHTYKPTGFVADPNYTDPVTGLPVAVAKDTARLTAMVELKGSENSKVYYYTVVANDMSMTCPLVQPIEIMVKKVGKQPGVPDNVPVTYSVSRPAGLGDEQSYADVDPVDPNFEVGTVNMPAYPRITYNGEDITDERGWLYYNYYLPDYSARPDAPYTNDQYDDANDAAVPGMIRGHGRSHHYGGPARFIRLYRGYHLYAVVQPEPTYGYVSRQDYNGTYVDSRTLYCPGNVVNLNTCTPWQDMEFMFWDFDPQADNETHYIMRQSDATVAAFYSPSTYWWQTITSPSMIPTVDYGDGVTRPGYEVNYRGTVTIRNAEGLAWLISTANGLNGQPAQSFVFDTIYLVPGHYNMSAHYWSPIGNLNVPFRGIFTKHPTETGMLEADAGGNLVPVYDDVELEDIICSEDNFSHVGLFGCLDSAYISDINIRRLFFIGDNFVGGIAARAINNTVLKNIEIHNGNLDAANVVGGLVGYGDNITIDNCHVGTTGNDIELDDEYYEYVGRPTYYKDADEPDTAKWHRNEWPCRVGEDAFTGTDYYVFDGHHTTDAALQELERVFYQQYADVDILGDAVYAGGIIGYAKDCRVTNSSVEISGVNSRALFFGGTAGYVDNTASPSPSLFKRLFGRNKGAKPAASTVMSNNYIHITTGEGNFRVGGIVGTASNATLSNSYVYGELDAGVVPASLVAILGNNVNIDHCYYNYGMAHSNIVGAFNGSGSNLSRLSSFQGSGSNVRTERSNYGVNNLTRALNLWVVDKGDSSYNYWRSDLDTQNNGYPLFGEPDIVPVIDTASVLACESYEWEGQLLTVSGVYSVHYIDSAMFVDSVLTLTLSIGHDSRSEVLDSLEWGLDYNSNGFHLSAEEIKHLLGGDTLNGVHTLVVIDSMLTAHGCDSLVVLQLTLNRSDLDLGSAPQSVVNVYPNPTTASVTVEATGLRKIELYDAVSRLLRRVTTSSDSQTVDMSLLPAGSYYFRITTANGITVQKVIKL